MLIGVYYFGARKGLCCPLNGQAGYSPRVRRQLMKDLATGQLWIVQSITRKCTKKMRHLETDGDRQSNRASQRDRQTDTVRETDTARETGRVRQTAKQLRKPIVDKPSQEEDRESELFDHNINT